MIEQVGDVYWTRDIITRKRATFAEQDALLDEVFFRYRVLSCCIDQTGMGEKPVEDAKRRHGTYRVEGVPLPPAINSRWPRAARKSLKTAGCVFRKVTRIYGLTRTS
ncbi:MAG: hypothetical protein ACR5LG_00635 [Sodalis sp. (in: enterobacteria)]|uniref:phage terminase large subunit family protein n=1 Tax=Sodalis sp. (in: enterobacteria) TaxID=1898979 RepID=UPI003F33EA1D